MTPSPSSRSPLGSILVQLAHLVLASLLVLGAGPLIAPAQPVYAQDADPAPLEPQTEEPPTDEPAAQLDPPAEEPSREPAEPSTTTTTTTSPREPTRMELLQAISRELEEEAPRTPRKGDPHGGSDTWTMPPPAIQLEQDRKLRPAAMGGIFVPSMSGGRAEPKYIVIDPKDGDEIQGRTGEVVYVLPGTYAVLVGSGSPEEMLEFEVNVVEGRVTFVPVEWGGVTITVVNQRGTPFRGSYELVRLPEREYVGIGLGADLASGETLDTWLLWPGQYMILAAGESYQARQNFATFRVLPGELVQYTIVLDETSGNLLGAGEIALAPETTGEGGYDVNLIVGGSVQFAQSKNVIGKNEGMTLDVAAFIEAVGAMLVEQHYVYGRLNIELGGRIDLPDPDNKDDRERPFITNVDELALDLLYAYKLLPWFGPYVRTSFETNMLKGVQVFDEPTDIRRVDSKGRDIVVRNGEVTRVDQPVVVHDVLEVELTESFAPIFIEAGTGVRFDFSAGFWFNFDARTGIGLRQVFARDSFVVADDEDTPETELRLLDDVTQFGAEAGLILEFNPFQWLQLKTDAEILVPFDDPENLLLDFRGAVTFRLGSIASLAYVIRIAEDRQLVDATQIDHSLLLRFAYKIF